MGLITKEVEVNITNNTIKYYEAKGYVIPRVKDDHYRSVIQRGTKLLIKVKDLPDKSSCFVNIECDCCNTPKTIKWKDYKRFTKEDGKYYCKKCSNKSLSRNEKILNSKLKHSKSFEQWCIENNRQDILDRWDYELNDYKPSEILYSTNKKFYFKCPRGIHKSELKLINSFVNGSEGSMNCRQCNSFAQWGIDNIGKDFLKKYWSNKNILNPWEISRGSRTKKILINCQNDVNHKDYKTFPLEFKYGSRCPECSESKGEKECKRVFISRRFININQENYDKLSNLAKQNKEYFICQKVFDDLIGIGGGLLSYDFYLPNYNLLIEYQGIQHEKPIDFKGLGQKYAQEQFEIQQEHDRRKKECSKDYNIRLLEIWYWEFDNIEEILQKELLGKEVVNIA